MFQVQSLDREEIQTLSPFGGASKRPRMDSFDSGNASNLTLDEADTGSAKKRYRLAWRKNRQKQVLQDQEKSSRNKTGIWDSLKEQLFDPDRTVLYWESSASGRRIVPTTGIGESKNNTDGVDEIIFATPSRRSKPSTGSPTAYNKFETPASVCTNLSSSTPHPSSGAYCKKYGLARWLSQNLVDDDERLSRQSKR